MNSDLKRDARRIFEAGLRAVDPREAVNKFLAVEGNMLRLGEQELNLDSFRSILVIGAGKGSALMAQAVEEILGDRIGGGIGQRVDQARGTDFGRQHFGLFLFQDVGIELLDGSAQVAQWLDTGR